jgi:hypothetical protein
MGTKKQRTKPSDLVPAWETTRREFLKGATVATASALSLPVAKAGAQPNLPTIALGRHRVTRMIVGSNPVYGYSHFNRQYDMHMMEWFTDERIVKFLQDCEHAGINTWQASYNESMTRQFPKIRAAGCNIQWICLAASWHLDPKLPRTIDAVVDGTIKCAQAAAKLKPIGIAFHGWATDMLYRDGKLDRLKEFIDSVHDLGVAAGLSTHNPEILDAMESKGWNNDFYMASFHYLSRRPEDWKRDIGTTPFGELYITSDPPKMCAAVRRAKKPCLVYKVLAAGRKCSSPKDVRTAFEFAFHNIKPIDGTIIGLYPRFYPDQIADDTRIVREILA